MATVRQIATSAGVSTATVSRVLNGHPGVSDDARDRVMTVANDRRYVASDGPRNTTNLALVAPGGVPLGDLLQSPFDIALLRGISRAADEKDFNLMLLDCGRSKRADETHSQMFHRKGVRGAVLHGSAHNHGVCRAIADEGFPAVVVAERIDHPGLSRVCGDSHGSSREAVDHLLTLGHRRIGVCIHWYDDTDHTDRLDAWSVALADAGLDAPESFIIRMPATRDSGAQLLRRWRGQDPAHRPTAWFIADPMTAAGLLQEASASGVRVPEELSLVGFDDDQLRHTTSPRMTAVCQDAEACGHRAGHVLHELIETDPGRRMHVLLPTRFEVHGTTAPPA